MEINIDVSSLEETVQLQKDSLYKTCTKIYGYLDQYSELLLKNIYNPNRVSQIGAQARKDVPLLMKEFDKKYSNLYKCVELIIAMLDADANRITQGKTQDQIYSDYQLRNRWQQLRRRSEHWRNDKSLLETMNKELKEYASIINFMNDQLSNLDNDSAEDDLNDYGDEPDVND